ELNRSLLPRKIFAKMQTKTGWIRQCSGDFLISRKSRGIQPIRRRISQSARAPNEINRWENKQLHERGSNDAADHRRSDALHHVCASAMAPENWHEAADYDRSSHRLGTHALHCSVIDGIAQVGRTAHFSFALPLIVSQVEVKKHNYPRLRTHARERDQTDPDSHA